ncbi:DUF6894 family protein [Methylobacterium oxalidis]|uniref:DUF6894 family protein n=1 Tax=Methylobacterium oxalidis TaxID=944322 RepID=UPI00331480FB
MPLFFFDIDDGEQRRRDDTGTECKDLTAARDAAIGILPDIAREVLPNGDHRVFISTVRDEAGRTVFQARLSLTAEWVRN